jgi:hypothetical protein
MKSIKILKKDIIVVIDVILWRVIWFLFSETTGIGIGTYIGEQFQRELWMLSYIFYFVLPEFFFKRSLAMKLFGVKIDEKNGTLKNQLIYMIFAFFDRTILFVINAFYGIMGQNEYKLFFSENFSGFRLVKTNSD